MCKKFQGSSNGHSPVLNLSKSGALDQGSTGDQSDRSENPSPAPSIRDEDENLSEDNLSDVDDRGAKDDGKFVISFPNFHVYEWIGKCCFLSCVFFCLP